MDANKTITNSFLQDISLDVDTEGILIANAIRDEEIRKTLLRRTSFMDFRVDQCRAMAWAITELSRDELGIYPDSIATMVNKSPVKPTPSYDDVINITNTYPVVSKRDYDEIYIPKLIEDNVRVKLARHLLDRLLKEVSDRSIPMEDVRASFVKAVSDIDASKLQAKCHFESIITIADRYVEEKNKAISKRSCGIPCLNPLFTEGLKEKTITVVCGTPGMGKSSLLLSMFNGLAHEEKPVPTGLFALEMHNMAVFTKLLSYNSNLAISNLTPQFHEMDADLFAEVKSEIDRIKESSKSIYMQDRPQSLKTVRTQICLLQDLLQTEYIPVALDLFGKLRDFGGSDNFARDYEKALNECQQMVKELNIPLILVAQINREAAKRNKSGRPTMSDLKNAGALEEVADLILGVHRPNYNPDKALKNSFDTMNIVDVLNTDDDDDDKWDVKRRYQNKEFSVTTAKDFLAEVHVLKQRMGKANVFELMMFDVNTTAYRELTPAAKELMSKSIQLESEGY